MNMSQANLLSQANLSAIENGRRSVKFLQNVFPRFLTLIIGCFYNFASGRKFRSARPDNMLECFEPKYPKAMECLRKDRTELLAFYDFPAEHWVHIRTTNPIESTFATVRLRSKRSKNCGSRETTLTMVFKLLESAEKRWRKFKGFSKLELVINNVKFKDGEMVKSEDNRVAA